MRLVRSALAGCVVATLLATSLAVPVMAAPVKGKMAIVQGNPSAKVDVCINGREIKSKMRFGTKVYRTFPAGLKVLKVTKDRNSLREKYYKKMRKALGGVMAARFFQIDRVLNDIIDIQIFSEIPLVLKTKVPAVEQK